MSRCQLELKAAGAAYPRTCPTCGLSGACVKGLSHGQPKRPPMPADMTREGLAADALYVAVRDLLRWDQQRGYLVPYRVRDPLHKAMRAIEAAAAIRGEGK